MTIAVSACICCAASPCNCAAHCEHITLPLADGREATVGGLAFGRARLHVGERGALCYSDAW